MQGHADRDEYSDGDYETEDAGYKSETADPFFDTLEWPLAFNTLRERKTFVLGIRTYLILDVRRLDGLEVVEVLSIVVGIVHVCD